MGRFRSNLRIKRQINSESIFEMRICLKKSW
jgi:hypothetical protein